MQRAWVAGAMLFAASCAQIVGMEEGIPRQDGPVVECEVFEDCLAGATECRVPDVCNAGTCQFKNTIRGKPLTKQTAGDCKEVVCDGNGATELVVKDDDVEDDNNECTMDSCKGGDIVHMPLPGKIIACYDGPAGTKDVGICVAGTQACDAQGQPIPPCDGQVLPKAEVCDMPATDEDCNGMANETSPDGGNCTCGDMVTSPGIGETCDDGNSVWGDGCTPQCSTIEAVQLAVGGDSTCVRFSTDIVKCWGININGRLGIGSVMPIGSLPEHMGANLAETPLPKGKKIVKLVVGGTFSCALLDDNQLRCWGENTTGQLGEGNTNHRGDMPGEMGDAIPAVDLGTTETIVDFSLGVRHACVLFANGMIKCWGASGAGQTGLGQTQSVGDAPGEMGMNLPTVDLGTGVTAKQIALGDASSCAILSDDRVKCWGTNAFGELGIGDTMGRGSAPMQMGDNLPYVDLGTGRTAKAITAGSQYVCAILDDDSVKCWGVNGNGQLGLGDTLHRGDAPGEMGDALPTVNLGTGRKAVMIAAGTGTTCALLDDQTVKCWGLNHKGQLGMGDMNNRGSAPNEMGDALLPIDFGTGRHVTSIQMGSYMACVMLDNTSVKCWGINGPEGRLGLGDTDDRGDAPNEMGDNLPIVKLFSDTW